MIFDLYRYNRLIRPSEGPNDTVRIAFRLKLSDLTDVVSSQLSSYLENLEFAFSGTL